MENQGLIFGIEHLVNAFGEVSSSVYLENLSLLRNVSIALGASFILVNFIVIYIIGKEDMYSGQSKPALSMRIVIRQFGYILLMFLFPVLSSYLDGILAWYSASVLEGINANPNSLYNCLATAVNALETENAISEGETGSLTTISRTLLQLISPFYWITSIGQWIGWFSNVFAQGFIIVERGVLLLILQLLAPLFIALAALDQFRGVFLSWFKLYAAVYLILPAVILIITITDSLFMVLTRGMGLHNALGLINFDVMIVVLLLVFVKVRLYRSAWNMLYKIFGV